MFDVLSYNLKSLTSKYILLILLGATSSVLAQKKVNFQYNNIELKTALNNLINEYQLSIVFPDTIPNTPITQSCIDCSQDEALSLILSSTYLKWEKSNSQYIILIPDYNQNYSISGRATDFKTGEPIPYANVFIIKTNSGDISNNDGLFSISNITTLSCSLSVSYIGYETKIIPLSFPKDENNFKTIPLDPKILNSKEISITGYTREFMDRSNIPGQVSFSPRYISTLPNLGEVDIFRSLQYLPGIQLGLGGTSNLYIRGGLPEQNLIILDGMPVYQNGHMFGFITSIAADAIKDVQVYKGGVPPQYGGRISSVIELSSRSGNSINPNGAVYANFMSQGLTTEIPILKRGSLIINIRKSNPSTDYSNLYTSIQRYITGDNKFSLLTQTANNYTDQNTTYDIKSSYEDITSRLSILINPRHKITFTQITGTDSVAESRDYFGFSSILGRDSIHIDEKTNLINTGLIMNLSSKWNHIYNSNFSISMYKISSKYLTTQFSIMNEIPSTIIGYLDEKNNFNDHRIKFHHQLKIFNDHKFSGGFEETFLSSDFNTIREDGTSSNTSQIEQDNFLHAFFFQDEWNIFNNTEILSGFRISYLNSNSEFFIEPRLSLKHKLQSNISLEASLDKHHQFIHKISSNNFDTRGTQNMWILSTKNIPVIYSNNYHLGITWDNKNYSFSHSLYSRQIENIFQFNDSFMTTITNNNINNELYVGSGTSNGLEIILRRKIGLISGWMAYHLNNSKYNFPKLNNGKDFLADHGKMHELKIIAITKLWNFDLSASWVFSSGGVYTDKDNMYVEAGSGFDIVTIGNQNSNILPSIHHLDINISRSVKYFKTTIDIGCSIYNLYNKNNLSHKRYNPYTPELSITNVSMFGITPNAYIKVSF